MTQSDMCNGVKNCPGAQDEQNCCKLHCYTRHFDVFKNFI